MPLFTMQQGSRSTSRTGKAAFVESRTPLSNADAAPSGSDSVTDVESGLKLLLTTLRNVTL